MGNQVGNTGNQGGNLCIVVEMTQNTDGNGKFKELTEVPIMENENLVSRI